MSYKRETPCNPTEVRWVDAKGNIKKDVFTTEENLLKKCVVLGDKAQFDKMCLFGYNDWLKWLPIIQHEEK